MSIFDEDYKMFREKQNREVKKNKEEVAEQEKRARERAEIEFESYLMGIKHAIREGENFIWMGNPWVQSPAFQKRLAELFFKTGMKVSFSGSLWADPYPPKFPGDSSWGYYTKMYFQKT